MNRPPLRPTTQPVRRIPAAVVQRRAAAARRRGAVAVVLVVLAVAGWLAFVLRLVTWPGAWTLGAVPTVLFVGVMVAGRRAVVTDQRADAAYLSAGVPHGPEVTGGQVRHRAQEMPDAGARPPRPETGARPTVPAHRPPVMPAHPRSAASVPTPAHHAGRTPSSGPRTGQIPLVGYRAGQMPPAGHHPGQTPSNGYEEIDQETVDLRGRGTRPERTETGAQRALDIARTLGAEIDEQRLAAQTARAVEAERSARGGEWTPTEVPAPTYTTKAQAPRWIPEPLEIEEVRILEVDEDTLIVGHNGRRRAAEPPAEEGPVETEPPPGRTGGSRPTLDLDAVLARRRAAGE